MMSVRGAALVAAAGYAGITVAAVLTPRRVPRLFGADAPTKASRNEIRAVYGGISAVFVMALLRAGGDDAGRARIRVVRDAGLAMAAVRATSAMWERDSAPWPTAGFVGIELGLAGAAHAALAGRPR